MIVPRFENDWSTVLASETEQPYFQQLLDTLAAQYEQEDVYPAQSAIFNAFHYTAYSDVRVVILGQDPYHGPGQAHGLSFSVLPGVKKPPSLLNMLKELQSDLGCEMPEHGCLVSWARQGVLLMNTVLTVRDGQAASHQGLGWERFTDRVIAELNKRQTPVVFVLWGKHAQVKEKLIDTDRHAVIASAHPSPLSARRGFFGSRPYSTVNDRLREIGLGEIDWQIPPLAALEAAAAAGEA